MEITDPNELSQLMDEKAYKEFEASEESDETQKF
jgi:hypothetical protein